MHPNLSRDGRGKFRLACGLLVIQACACSTILTAEEFTRMKTSSSLKNHLDEHPAAHNHRVENSKVKLENHHSFAVDCAYNALSLPFLSQLANFHSPSDIPRAVLFISGGRGGKFTHSGSSNVISWLRRKKSNVFLMFVGSIEAASWWACAIISARGIIGWWLTRPTSRGISLSRCLLKTYANCSIVFISNGGE